MPTNNLNKILSTSSEVTKESNRLFKVVDAHISAKFEIDGKTYDISDFDINFMKEIDHKGQPQSGAKGGQFCVTLTQSPTESISYWATREYAKKNGAILFQTESSGTILEIKFENAYCVHFSMSVDAHFGTQVSLVIAPEKIIMSGTPHDNKWSH